MPQKRRTTKKGNAPKDEDRTKKKSATKEVGSKRGARERELKFFF